MRTLMIFVLLSAMAGSGLTYGPFVYQLRPFEVSFYHIPQK